MAIDELTRRGEVVRMEGDAHYSREEFDVTAGEELKIGDVLEDDSGKKKKVVVAANADAVSLDDFPGKVVAALAKVLATANPANTNTITIGGKTYTFQTTLTDVDGNVDIGADADESLDNLVAAITLGAGSGTAYAASMTENADATARVLPGDAIELIAKTKGAVGNKLALSATGTWHSLTAFAGGDGQAKAKAVCLVRHAIVDGDKLDYNGQTVATVDTALAGVGIVVRK